MMKAKILRKIFEALRINNQPNILYSLKYSFKKKIKGVKKARRHPRKPQTLFPTRKHNISNNKLSVNWLKI